MTSKVFFRIYKGSDLVEVKQFETDQIVIGQKANVQIDLEGQEVSPIHALVERRGRDYFLCDLGSQGGTTRNGEKVLDVPLTSGDYIAIGPYRLEFYIGVPKPEDLPPESIVIDEKTEVADALPGEIPEKTLVGVHVPSTAESEIVDEKTVVDDSIPSSIPSSQPAKSKIGKKTFASASEVKNLKELLRPTRGPTVEVVVAWKERIVQTYHFSGNQNVVMGGHEGCQIYLPIYGNNNIEHRLLRIQRQALVFLAPNMEGEHITAHQETSFPELRNRGRMVQKGQDQTLLLEQGEMVKIDLPGDIATLYIRYVEATPKVVPAPMFDFTLSEMVGILTSIVASFLLFFYVSMNEIPEEDKGIEELSQPKRRAQFIYKPPKLKPKVPIKLDKIPPINETKIAKVKRPHVKKSMGTRKNKAGAAARIRPKNLPKAPKKVATVRSGGAKKIGKKKGASAATVEKDISKVGILGVFGNKGYRDKLETVSSGAGILQGLAEQATGGVGQDKDRLGVGTGRSFKETGASGKGIKTVGIDSVVTKGRASGLEGYGKDGGLGDKKSVSIKLGGDEENFIGRIDKEAIRRVVVENLRQVRSCYEKELNRRPNLRGKLVLEWEIGDKGKVLNAKVREDTLGSKKVSSCIIGRLRNWRFPEPPPGVVGVVAYPFVFASQQ